VDVEQEPGLLRSSRTIKEGMSRVEKPISWKNNEPGSMAGGGNVRRVGLRKGGEGVSQFLPLGWGAVHPVVFDHVLGDARLREPQKNRSLVKTQFRKWYALGPQPQSRIFGERLIPGIKYRGKAFFRVESMRDPFEHQEEIISTRNLVSL